MCVDLTYLVTTVNIFIVPCIKLNIVSCSAKRPNFWYNGRMDAECMI